MISVLIVEDEDTAADRLAGMLTQLDTSIRVLKRCESISETIQYLKTAPAPGLIFMDINLADGSSFEIFKQVEVNVPVIFVTAYDEYALQAFKVNSIDYLLKPVKKTELQAAIAKYEKISSPVPAHLNGLLKTFGVENNPYQKRIVVKFGQLIKAVEIDEIAYFYTEERVVLMCTRQGQRIPVDYNLDELEELLDPLKFYRVNRQIIANIKAIDTMFAYSKSRIKLVLDPPLAMEAIVSTERTSGFKDWLKGKTV